MGHTTKTQCNETLYRIYKKYTLDGCKKKNSAEQDFKSILEASIFLKLDIHDTKTLKPGIQSYNNSVISRRGLADLASLNNNKLKKNNRKKWAVAYIYGSLYYVGKEYLEFMEDTTQSQKDHEKTLNTFHQHFQACLSSLNAINNIATRQKKDPRRELIEKDIKLYQRLIQQLKKKILGIDENKTTEAALILTSLREHSNLR